MELLNRLLQSVGIVTRSQDEDKIMHPAAGAFVPVNYHRNLDCNFYVFLKGEHVAYEVYDPMLLSTYNAAHGCDGNMESGASAEAVYVYAVILGEVEKEACGNKEKPALLRNYQLDLGEGRIITSSATKLYRFLLESKEENVASEKQWDDHAELLEPAIAVYREIRTILKEARQLPNEEDRRRVRKRLILKWHVHEDDCDKSCNPVGKALAKQLNMLFHFEYDDAFEQTVYLSMGKDDEVDAHPKSRASENRQQMLEMFFVHKRKCHRHLERNTLDGRYNPQHLEGQRWFRQAQADLQTALSAMGSYHQGFNWICFLCHQAFEKGLKALLYFRDANKCPLNIHSLAELSSLIDDPQLKGVARDMELLVGRHTDMRYPDLLKFPLIPAEVYSVGQADQACRLSHQALQRIGQLLQ